MEALVKLVPLIPDLWVYIIIDVGLAMVLLITMKLLTSLHRKDTSVTEELGVKDNIAFGISIAGGMLSLCIVIGSVVGRHIGLGYENAAIGVVVFGIVGIVLVKFGRYSHDKLVLNRVDSEKMIGERNVSIALVDAASLVASAIILRSMVLWVDGTDMNAIIAIVTGFLVVLAMLLGITRLHEVRYATNNQNDSFQAALRKGQLSLAVEHSGNLLGTALIITSASALLDYSPIGYVSNVTGWLIVSVGLAFALWLLVSLSKRIILSGIDCHREVEQQDNVGIASVGFTFNIGMALIINGILVV
jgi:hypothetical protein